MVVTHELGFAREVADRVMFMDRGQVVETSDPETFFSNARAVSYTHLTLPTTPYV